MIVVDSASELVSGSKTTDFKDGSDSDPEIVSGRAGEIYDEIV